MTPFLKQVAEDLVAKFGTNLQHCAIVFNNKRPATYLRKHLADAIKKPFFSPAIYTIQEFFAGSVKEQVADFYTQFFTLLNVYNGLLEKEGLSKLESSQFFSLAKIILSDFAQIDNDLVDADKLYQEMKNVAEINLQFDYLNDEQHQFLTQFWESYHDGQQKDSQQKFIAMWRRMPLLYHQFHQQLKAQNYITHAQVYRFLAHTDLASLPFIQHFNRGKIIFVGFNALSKAEAAVFTQLQKADKALFYFDTDAYYLNDELQEAGLFLRKNIQKLGLKNVFEQPEQYMQLTPHQVKVYKVQGQAAQAKILNKIIDDNKNNRPETETTAVILADESLLLPAIQTITDGEDLNVTMGYPLANSAVFGLVDLWLSTQLAYDEQTDLPEKHVNFQTLEAFLTHPLTGLSQAIKDKIHQALLKENALTVGQNRLLKQGGIFEKFYQEATQPKEVIAALIALVKYVFARQSNHQTLKEIDAALFTKTIEELTRLNDALHQLMDNQAFTFIVQLVQKALQSISVPLSGEPLKGIQLMGLLESRNLNFDHVVFLGFNEGVIPKTSMGNSFIPDSIRRAFHLPVLENLDAISSYMVYRLLQRAKNISFVYNSLTDESSSGEASRIVKQLAYESNFKFTYHTLQLPVGIESATETRIDKKNEKIKAALQCYLAKQKKLSPSAITTYIANPIDFFFSYIAHIKEPKQVTELIEANQVGSILHKVMELFYQDFVGKEVSLQTIQQKRKNIASLLNQAFDTVMFKERARLAEYSGMQKVILAIVENYAKILLDKDEEYAPFTILHVEKKVSTELDFELNGKKESIIIEGFIDRIDEREGITRIVDYKTGGDKLSFAEIEKNFDTNGKNINKALLQTLLYAYTYQKQAGVANVIPCLYVVRTMSTDGIYFYSKKQILNADNIQFLQEVNELFLTHLKTKLTELFDENTPFVASTVPDNYQYSIYTHLFDTHG